MWLVAVPIGLKVQYENPERKPVQTLTRLYVTYRTLDLRSSSEGTAFTLAKLKGRSSSMDSRDCSASRAIIHTSQTLVIVSVNFLFRDS